MERLTSILYFIKNAGNDANWRHADEYGNPDDERSGYTISQPEITSANGEFQVKELNGSAHFACDYEDCRVRDNSASGDGSDYTPTSPADLVNKLIELKYPAYNYLLSASTLQEVIDNSPKVGGAVVLSPDVQILIGEYDAINQSDYSYFTQSGIGTTTASGTVAALNSEGYIELNSGGSPSRLKATNVAGGDQTYELPPSGGEITVT